MARISGAAISIRRSVFVVAAVLAAASANAQDQPSVTVDMSVLEELGPPPAETPEDAITLRPPERPPVQQARPAPEAEPRSEAAAAPSEPAPPAAPETAAAPEPAPAEPEAAPGPEPEPQATTSEAEPESQVTAPAREPDAAAPDPAPGAGDASSPEASPAEDDTPAAAAPSPPEPTEPAGEAAAEEPPEEAAPEVQSAARTPSDEGQPTLRLAFAAGSAELPDGADAGLARVVDVLAADEAKRLVISAFADGSGRTESQARRLSLSRALAVRRYLVENGIRGTRAEIRALGQRSEGGPADRVDLAVVER